MATEQFDAEMSEATRTAKTKITWASLIIGALVILSLILLWRFASTERHRDQMMMGNQMGVVVDGRAAAIRGWLSNQMVQISDLADNTTIRLMLSQPAAQTEDTLPIEAEYVRNLLIAKGKNFGFLKAEEAGELPVNVVSRDPMGLAVLNKEGQAILSISERTPLLDAHIQAFVNHLPPGGRSVMDMYKDPVTGKAVMAFIAPVQALQSTAPDGQRVGYVIGVKDVSKELFPLLAEGMLDYTSSELILVRQHDGIVQNLSPLKDGSQAFDKSYGSETDGLASTLAISAPGQFEITNNYVGERVVTTSRPIGEGLGWMVVYSVDVAEAFQESGARLSKVVTILFLLMVLVVAIMVGAWRHAASKKSEEALTRSAALARLLEDQKNMLKLVTDNQPKNIMIFDLDNRVHFANRAVSHSFGLEESDVVGKMLPAVFGPDIAEKYIRRGREALENSRPTVAIERQERQGATHILQIQHIPLKETSVAPAGVLVVEEDITLPVLERENREKTLNQLVDTLVTLVDKRDPFAAGHSTRVSRMAKSIAAEMELDETLIDTAGIAGSVMNLGKITVPPELLTKPGELSDKERGQIRNSIRTIADVLSVVDFDGPVVKTLRQVQERYDGTGQPEGWRGDDIIVTARVVSVANAFVALISPRAHRSGHSLDDAIEQLMKQVGTAFDRRVVSAMVSYIDNHGGRDVWIEEALKAQKQAPTKANPADEVAKAVTS